MPSETDPLEHQIAVLVSSQILAVPETVGIQEDLFDRGLDSMGIMQLLLLLAEHFNAEVPYGEVSHENFQTCGCIARVVARFQARAVGQA